MSRVLTAVLLTLALALAGCGGEEPETGSSPPPTVDDLPAPCEMLDADEAGEVVGAKVEARPHDSDANALLGASRSCSYVLIAADELASPDLVVTVTAGGGTRTDLEQVRMIATAGDEEAVVDEVDVDGATRAFTMVPGDQEFPTASVLVALPDVSVTVVAFGDDTAAAEVLALAAAPVAVAGVPG